MTRTRSMTVSLTVAAMLVLAGCSNNPSDQTSTPAPTADPVPTTQPAPTEPATTTEAPPVDEDVETTTAPPELNRQEQDQADIEETLQAYSTALDRAIIGEESIEGIYPFSRDTAREKWLTQVLAYQAQGVVFTGLSELEVLEILAGEDRAEAVACVDVSDVEAIDADGDSYITEDRLDQTLKDFVLERDDSAEFGWYVVEDTNRNEPCEG